MHNSFYESIEKIIYFLLLMILMLVLKLTISSNYRLFWRFLLCQYKSQILCFIFNFTAENFISLLYIESFVLHWKFIPIIYVYMVYVYHTCEISAFVCITWDCNYEFRYHLVEQTTWNHWSGKSVIVPKPRASPSQKEKNNNHSLKSWRFLFSPMWLFCKFRFTDILRVSI